MKVFSSNQHLEATMGYVLFVLILLVILVRVWYGMYRDWVRSWKDLLDMGFSVIEDNYGRVIEYRLFDQKIVLWKVPFLLLDAYAVKKSAPETRVRYFREGKLLPETPELLVEIWQYEKMYKNAYEMAEGRPWRHRGFARVVPPYDAKEVSFIPPDYVGIAPSLVVESR